MLNIVARKITNHLLLKQVILKESFDIYVYGFEILLSSLFSVSVILVLGCLIGQFAQTLCFLLLFISLRSFTGGYHANTYLICAIVTFSVFLIVLSLSNLIVVSNLIYIFFAILGAVIIFMISPIENPNKKITKAQKNKFKIISVVLFVLFVSFGLYIKQFNVSLSCVVFFTLLADIILLFIKNPKERRKI